MTMTSSLSVSHAFLLKHHTARLHELDFCPVVEHFELQSQFFATLASLQEKLRNKGLNERTVDTIDSIYRNGFINVIECCVSNTQSMPYANRSNKKNDTISRAIPKPDPRNQANRDSGVVIDDISDDGSGTQSSLGRLNWEHEPNEGDLYHSDSVRTARRMSVSQTPMQQPSPFTVPSQATPQLLEQQFPAGGTSGGFSTLQILGLNIGSMFAPEQIPEAWSNGYQSSVFPNGVGISQDQFPRQEGMLNDYPGWDLDLSQGGDLGHDFAASETRQ